MPKKKGSERHAKPKSRLSLADAAIPASIVVLAAVEEGSQGGEPVLDELTTYVVDQYDAGNGISGVVGQIATGAADLAVGAVSLEGVVILGAGVLGRHVLKHHGKSYVVAKTRNHRISLGG